MTSTLMNWAVGQPIDWMPQEIAVLKDTPQDPIWHPEGNALTHTLLVVAEMDSFIKREHIMASHGPASVAINRLAALYHDVGKGGPEGVGWEVTNGRFTSRNHAKRGAAMIRELLPLHGVPSHIVDAVAILTEVHMNFIDTQRAMRRLIKKLVAAGAGPRQLFRLMKADSFGRGQDLRGEEKVCSPELFKMLECFNEYVETPYNDNNFLKIPESFLK